MAITGKVGQGATAVLGSALLAMKIKLPTWEIEAVEASHLGTTDFKQKIPGKLADPGTCEIEIIHDGAPPAVDGTILTLTITRPDSGGTLAGTGFVSSVDHGEIVGDGLQMSTITFTFDGDTGPTIS